VVHHRDGGVGPAHRAAGGTHPSKACGLVTSWRGAVDVESAVPSGASRHVVVPDLVE
jgi:hypothetical protein